jgi:predicted dehydrogenase
MTVRIGVIGGGIYGTAMLTAYHAAQKTGLVELVALADINEDVLKQKEQAFGLKGYTDYKEMMDKEELDAVAVVTPDYLHREIALAVADKGLHMLVQKPLDTSSKGGQEMVDAAKKNNVMLYVDFHKRFDPSHITLKNNIKSGKLGKVQYGYAWSENRILVPTVSFKKWAHHSSPAWFLGIHMYDIIYWTLESLPRKVYATGIKSKLVGMGIDTYDSIQAKIEFENGAQFAVDSSWILPNNFPSGVNQGIRVVGSDGITEVDLQDRGIFSAFEDNPNLSVPNPYGRMEWNDPLYGKAYQGYTVESMYYFLRLVQKLKDGAGLDDIQGTYSSGEEALVATRICEAVHISADTGRIIEL